MLRFVSSALLVTCVACEPNHGAMGPDGEDAGDAAGSEADPDSGEDPADAEVLEDAPPEGDDSDAEPAPPDAEGVPDPDPTCPDRPLAAPGTRPKEFSVGPDAVCLKGRWRQRCVDDRSCGEDYGCCWGLCIPHGVDAAFCETCPCGDGPACAPAPARTCDALPTPNLEHVVSDRIDTPATHILPPLVGCGPTFWSDQEQGHDKFSLPEFMIGCAPLDGSSSAAPCGFDYDISNGTERTREHVLCDEHGDVAIQEQLAYFGASSGALSFVTRSRDACHDQTLRVTSSIPGSGFYDEYEYDVAMTVRSDVAVSVCRAHWQLLERGAAWQVDESRTILEHVGDHEWSWAPRRGTSSKVVRVDSANRVLEIVGDDDETSFSYDERGQLLSRSSRRGAVLLTEHRYEYDEAATLLRHVVSDQSRLLDDRFDYDEDGRLFRIRRLSEGEERVLSSLPLDSDGRVVLPMSLDEGGRVLECGDLIGAGRFTYAYAPADCAPLYGELRFVPPD